MLAVTDVIDYLAFLKNALYSNSCTRPLVLEPTKMVYRSVTTIAQVVGLSNYFESPIQLQIFERAMIDYSDKIRLNKPAVEQFLLTTTSIQ